MNEKPILFSGPMVNAILQGRKTQTRRVIKPVPSVDFRPRVGLYCPTLVDRNGEQYPGPEVFGASDENGCYPCPYGRPGTFLWVRETWASRGNNPVARPSGNFGAAVIEYRADGQRATWDHDPIQRDSDGYWRPSIFMPRWASRITLEITDVRAERLQGISDEDCIAEGIEPGVLQRTSDQIYGAGFDTPLRAYQAVWEEINGPESWEANPWVWAISFRRVP